MRTPGWGDRIAIASYLGKGQAFDRAMAGFSAAYSGRLAARTGV